MDSRVSLVGFNYSICINVVSAIKKINNASENLITGTSFITFLPSIYPSKYKPHRKNFQYLLSILARFFKEKIIFLNDKCICIEISKICLLSLSFI